MAAAAAAAVSDGGVSVSQLARLSAYLPAVCHDARVACHKHQCKDLLDASPRGRPASTAPAVLIRSVCYADARSLERWESLRTVNPASSAHLPSSHQQCTHAGPTSPAYIPGGAASVGIMSWVEQLEC